ncbi:molybdenum cofactor guanylyltransferase MobA [Methyloceanibacter sp.]|uniref:molybdenum cofactor guanylyltransferase MobA n=1 Tax=Methyloceanibacter sp. TaxID=1965321 RepID=UPI00351B0838
MSSPEGVIGIVLAGGKSSRMGGGDKALLQLGGRPLLAHVVACLRPQVAEIVLNANDDPARFAPFGLPLVPDGLAGQMGPLAGIHAGLVWAKANRPGSHFVITVAADTPFFPADLVSQLCATTSMTDPKLVVARSESGVHPVFGLWPVSFAPDLEDSLHRGGRKALGFVSEHRAKELAFPPVEIGGRAVDPFFNINRPEDLAEAEALLRATARASRQR